MSKIGIAITTRNRYDVFKKSYEEIKRLSPNIKLVVVDDASTIPVLEADYRFEKQAGIAKAKNKCLSLLEDCEHKFLFDDDIFPIKENWWLPYINSCIKHLMFTFHTYQNGKTNKHKVLNTENGITEYSSPCGCMLYIHKDVTDVIGGFDESFGVYGHEHVNFSDRVYNAGLTDKRYQDVENSTELFYSLDWACETESSVKNKKAWILRNDKILLENRRSKAYIPYKTDNVLITTFFTSVSDPQRNKLWKPNHLLLDKLIKSLKKEKLIVLHDCFDLPNTDNVEYVKVETTHNPYFQRWISIEKFLNEINYDHVFCIDGTDIEIINSPFKSDLRGKLFVGDERMSKVDNKWFRETQNEFIIMEGYKEFLENYANRTLLNAGILGGEVEAVKEFLSALNKLYFDNKDNISPTDMPFFNYTAYTLFQDKIVHGAKVNTVFKAYDNKSKNSWFRHK